MNKVKAYTIMEMVVVMLISSVVISIAYTSFNMLTRQFLTFKSDSENISEIALLDRLLSNDFSRSDYVLRGVYGLNCVYKDKTIYYIFERDFILREDHHIRDTFFIIPENIKIMFLKEEMANVDKPVDELSFEQNYKEEQQLFYYRKNYGADVLMMEEQPTEDSEDI